MLLVQVLWLLLLYKGGIIDLKVNGLLLMKNHSDKNHSVQTTGHSWDGDLQELNNPLPTWWLLAFYASVVFSIVYWIIYPAWPIGDTYTKGVATTTYQDSSGKEVTVSWNSRAEFIKEMQSGEITETQRKYFSQIDDMSYENISSSSELMSFVRSTAKVLFSDNCAACHGYGGQPSQVGLYPSLRDDVWLWGGEYSDIHHALVNGRRGYMPAFGEVLSDNEIEQVANYVLSLSGLPADDKKVSAGKEIFQGSQGGCYSCHTSSGAGLYSQGAPNLTDKVWEIADVLGTKNQAKRVEAISRVIKNGVNRKMPSWSDRLSSSQIKLLTIYVKSLSGG